MTDAVHYRTTVLATGGTTTGIAVPTEVLEQLGGGVRPPVHVTVKGYSYRTTPGVMGGRTLLPLSAERRASAGVVAGDEVDVELSLDTEPHEVVLPPDLVDALAGHPEARAFLDGLSRSRRQ